MAKMEKESEAIIRMSENFLEGAQTYVLEDQESYDEAGIRFKTIDAHIKQVDKTRKFFKAFPDYLSNLVQQKFKPPIQTLESASQIYKRKRREHEQKQEELRRELQRKQDEIAAREAEKERKRLENRALTQERKGNIEKAEELREQKEEIEPQKAIIPETIQKTDGTVKKKIWYAVVVDPDVIPREYLTPDVKKLDAMAKAVKGGSPIPGVEFKWKELEY